MNRHSLIIMAISLSVIFSYSSDVFALGGGGFRNEAAMDAEANGMANAYVAQADSASAAHFNPAGLVQLDGYHVKTGLTYQAPRNSFTDLSGTENQMQKQTFLIPNFHFGSRFGLEDWGFGISVGSPYGLATDWADDGPSRLQATESDLEFYQINPAVAYKFNDVLFVGAGIDYMRSYISKHKRHSLGGGDFQLKGSDDAWGYNLGLLIKPFDKHSIGFSYRSKIELTYKGFASLDDISAGAQSAFNFPSSTYSTDIESKLTVPRSLAAGYAFKPNDKWTIEIDCEWTGWSSIEEDFVKFTSETDPIRLSALNNGNPAPKDWRDSMAYGIGTKYQVNDKLELRGGYLFYETPIPSNSFDTALPDSDRHAITLGTGYELRDGLILDLAYFGVLYVDRDVTNDVRTAAPDFDGEYKGYVNIISVGFSYKY